MHSKPLLLMKDFSQVTKYLWIPLKGRKRGEKSIRFNELKLFTIHNLSKFYRGKKSTPTQTMQNIID